MTTCVYYYNTDPGVFHCFPLLFHSLVWCHLQGRIISCNLLFDISLLFSLLLVLESRHKISKPARNKYLLVK